jgi:hypothetical protein
MSRPTRWVCSFAALMLACGGRVEITDDDPDNGSAGGFGVGGAPGGSAGVAGRGGAPGSGGALGSGGSAGRGGNGGTGGSAGSAVGGSAGAVTGGAGGAGGSSSEIFQKLMDTCEAMRAVGCAPSDCLAFLTQIATEAWADGCAREFIELLDCGLSANAFCTGGNPCQAQQQNLFACTSSNTCGHSSGSDGSCGLGCPDWAVECRPGPAGYWGCMCTRGARTGIRFTMSEPCSSSPSWNSAVETSCRGALASE